MRSNNESLSAEAQASVAWKRLLWRSGISVLVISGLLAGVTLLPYPRVKKERQAIHGHTCGSQDQLRHVIVLHRHGERSPVRWYDFEGDWEWESTDIGIGKLTVNGMKQGFELGQSLRDSYASSMQLGIDTDAVTCYSTDLDRTVDTANSVLLGLLSPDETEATEVKGPCECREENGKRGSPECLASCLQLENVPKTPDVQVRPRRDKDGNPRADQDAALYQTEVCKGYDAWRKDLETSKAWLDLPKTKFADARKISSELVGADVVKTLQWPGGDCEGCLHINTPEYNYLGFMETIWSDLVCYESIDQPYDSSQTLYTNKQLFDVLGPMSEYVWKQRFSTESGPMAGGVLLYEWEQVLNQSAELARQCSARPDSAGCGGSPAKMTIYSAHDTTVFSLLAALGATSGVELPGFTAHVIMELWDSHSSCEDSHDFSVRILYNPLSTLPFDDAVQRRLSTTPFDTPGAVELKPTACDTGRCPLEHFLSKTKHRVLAPEDCERGSNGVSHLHEPEDNTCCNAS